MTGPVIIKIQKKVDCGECTKTWIFEEEGVDLAESFANQHTAKHKADKSKPDSNHSYA